MRVVVVTGGASGIGRATVQRFLNAGDRIVFGDVNEANGQQLVDEIDEGDRLRFVPTDVADEADVAQLVATAISAFGRLDVMFNNAGVGGAFGPLTEIDVADWDRTFGVLTRGVFLGTKHAARAMIAHGTGGSIINTASVAGLAGGAGPQAYSAAKAAVINLTYTSAIELATHRIRVNAICPGLIYTPLAIRGDETRARELMATFQPWPDAGLPDHVAGLVLWLASDDSAFVTGEAIRVDGGVMAAGPRIVGLADPHGAFQRYAGFADGSTGRPTKKRSVSAPPAP